MNTLARITECACLALIALACVTVTAIAEGAAEACGSWIAGARSAVVDILDVWEGRP